MKPPIKSMQSPYRAHTYGQGKNGRPKVGQSKVQRGSPHFLGRSLSLITTVHYTDRQLSAVLTVQNHGQFI